MRLVLPRQLAFAPSSFSRSRVRLVWSAMIASATLSILGSLSVASMSAAQEKSVRPGVNKSFQEGKVDEFVGRFEKEGRDVFDRRHEVIEALALRPGMVVADIGQVVLIDFHRMEGKSTDWVLGHVRAGQEVFTREIVTAGFKQVDEKKDLLKESYFVRFEKVGQ